MMAPNASNSSAKGKSGNFFFCLLMAGGRGSPQSTLTRIEFLPHQVGPQKGNLKSELRLDVLNTHPKIRTSSMKTLHETCGIKGTLIARSGTLQPWATPFAAVEAVLETHPLYERCLLRPE